MTLTTVNPALLDTQAQYTGFKNRIINGAMAIAQRGNVVLSANGTTFGGPDRFFLTVGGFSTVSVIALQAGTVFPESAYSYQIGNLLTTGGPGTVTVTQRIESANSYDLNSQAVTFTVKVLQQTGASVNAQLVLRKPSAKDNFASVSLIANTGLIPVPDSTITTLTFTTTLGASDASNGLQAELYFPSMPATTNKQIYTGQWQLEKGSTATSFDYRPYGTELGLCQRYYQQRGGNSGDERFASGFAYLTTQGRFIYPTRVVMRATPSMSVSSGSDFRIETRGDSFVTSSLSLDQPSPEIIAINVNLASVLTLGAGCQLQANTINARLMFSAEL